MDDHIKKIFKLLNSPIITPYNLLDNAKLKNYQYVKYYKSDSGLIAEMRCLVDNVDTIFKYKFDQSDYLQKIYMSQDCGEECVFNRSDELVTLKEEYNKKQSSFSKLKAI